MLTHSSRSVIIPSTSRNPQDPGPDALIPEPRPSEGPSVTCSRGCQRAWPVGVDPSKSACENSILHGRGGFSSLHSRVCSPALSMRALHTRVDDLLVAFGLSYYTFHENPESFPRNGRTQLALRCLNVSSSLCVCVCVFVCVCVCACVCVSLSLSAARCLCSRKASFGG